MLQEPEVSAFYTEEERKSCETEQKSRIGSSVYSRTAKALALLFAAAKKCSTEADEDEGVVDGSHLGPRPLAALREAAVEGSLYNVGDSFSSLGALVVAVAEECELTNTRFRRLLDR